MLGNNIYIRADATAAMGIGHVMRCIALGQAIKKKGGAVNFMSHCNNETLKSRIIDEGFNFFQVACPDNDKKGLNDTLKKLTHKFPTHSEEIKKNPVWAVLDGYHFDSDFQKSIKDTGVKLLVVDDYNHLPLYYADIILNQNVGSNQYAYKTLQNTSVLKGLKYAMLREEFITKKYYRKQNRQKVNILVTMGGSDPYNATEIVVRALKKTNTTEFNSKIVIGPSNQNKNRIQSLIQTDERILLIQDADMPQLLRWADMAITAAGSTCWELCHAGVPLLTIIVADNQESLALNLEKTGASTNLGWISNINDDLIKASILDHLLDFSRRCKMAEIGMELVDGRGTDRILEHMEKVSAQ